MLILFGHFIIKFLFFWCCLCFVKMIFDVLDVDKDRQVAIGSILTIVILIYLYYLEL